jgi:hypothetical protein
MASLRTRRWSDQAACLDPKSFTLGSIARWTPWTTQKTVKSSDCGTSFGFSSEKADRLHPFSGRSKRR